MNARENRNDFSLHLNVPSESVSVTVLGREFQVAGAEQGNARLANAVLMNGSDNRVVMVECRVCMPSVNQPTVYLAQLCTEISILYCSDNGNYQLCVTTVSATAVISDSDS